jgi:surface antigen
MTDRHGISRTIRPLATAGLLLAVGLVAGCASRAAGPATAALGATGTRAGSSASYIAALGGGIIGQNATVKLSAADRQRALEAEYRALEAAPGGQPVIWQGAGYRGSVVASAPYQVGSQNCRQYSHTVTAGATDTVARGVACRNPNGTWTPLI